MEEKMSHRREQHHSDSIKGTACYGCQCMDVLTSGRRIVKERYWCSKLRRTIQPLSGCRAS